MLQVFLTSKAANKNGRADPPAFSKVVSSEDFISRYKPKEDFNPKRNFDPPKERDLSIFDTTIHQKTVSITGREVARRISAPFDRVRGAGGGRIIE